MPMKNRRTAILLWTAQVLLAALFVFAAYAKLSMPPDVLAAQSGMPAWFLQFIAVCELLGAAGLVLPGALGIREELTPLAAAGLTIIMVGAVVTSIPSMGLVAAILPAVTGVITFTVARSRWRLVRAGRAGKSSPHPSPEAA